MQFNALSALLNRFHSARVLVLGDVMLDRFMYGTAERISPEAPIPVINVERSTSMPGGAANVARNIAALGAQALLFGIVGDDVWSSDLHAQLALSPTIEPHLVADPSRPTTVKTRYVADGQQVMRADRESRAPVSDLIELRLLDQVVASMHVADVIVLSDYAKGTLSDAVVRATIKHARSAGKAVIVDPKSRDLTRYRGATILTPNRLELQQASGCGAVSDHEIATAARHFVDQGVCDFMVVTRGKDGMSVVGSSDVLAHLPTAARQVFDVSGAGDTVIAAIALGLAAGGAMVDAAALANIAAGLVVAKRGTATISTGEIIAALTSQSVGPDPQKIFSLDSVLQVARSWHEKGLKIAFTNGCFDLLHPGHISLLEQARRSADRLVVGLNADLSVRRLKGPNRPIQSEVARATVVAAVKSVDAVVIFSEDTPIGLIEILQPDVLVKGSDYTVQTVVGADLVLKRGGKVLLAELLPGHSTSDTVKRVTASSTA